MPSGGPAILVAPSIFALQNPGLILKNPPRTRLYHKVKPHAELEDPLPSFFVDLR